MTQIGIDFDMGIHGLLWDHQRMRRCCAKPSLRSSRVDSMSELAQRYLLSERGMSSRSGNQHVWANGSFSSVMGRLGLKILLHPDRNDAVLISAAHRERRRQFTNASNPLRYPFPPGLPWTGSASRLRSSSGWLTTRSVPLASFKNQPMSCWSSLDINTFFTSG